MKTTEEMIKIMQACIDGKEIESTVRGFNNNWGVVVNPNWDWSYYDYRIKEESKCKNEHYIEIRELRGN